MIKWPSKWTALLRDLTEHALRAWEGRGSDSDQRFLQALGTVKVSLTWRPPSFELKLSLSNVFPFPPRTKENSWANGKWLWSRTCTQWSDVLIVQSDAKYDSWMSLTLPEASDRLIRKSCALHKSTQTGKSLCNYLLEKTHINNVNAVYLYCRQHRLHNARGHVQLACTA